MFKTLLENIVDKPQKCVDKILLPVKLPYYADIYVYMCVYKYVVYVSVFFQQYGNESNGFLTQLSVLKVQPKYCHWIWVK